MIEQIDRLAADFTPDPMSQRFERTTPRQNMLALGASGILGVCLPERYGGAGRPYLDGMLAIERISKHCTVTGDHAVMAISGPAMFIAEWGSEEQKERFVPQIVRGESGCWVSLTEPEAGTALTDLTTSAVIEGEGCVVNGFKRPVPLSEQGDYFLVFVRFAEGHRGIGAVIVDRDAPGLEVGETHHWMGGGPWTSLRFTDTRIPAENVLFTGDAMRKLLASYSVERCAAGARCLGIAQLAFELAVARAETHTQFGRPLADFQMIQAKLADMYIELESARLLLYKAVSEQAEDGFPPRILSSAAKVATHEAACFVCDGAMQIYGAMGMSVEDEPIEWLYRLVRPLNIAGGTSEIHRSMIAAELVGRRFDHRGSAPA